MMITLIAKITAQPGKEDQLAQECIRLTGEVREKEEDCLSYIPHVQAKNPAVIVFIEKYKDQDALNFHSQTSYFKEAMGKIKELSIGSAEIMVLKELL